MNLLVIGLLIYRWFIKVFVYGMGLRKIGFLIGVLGRIVF